MRVFLTGATGYIGYAVGEALVRAGHEVFGLTHTPDKAPRLALAGIKPRLGDLRRPESYREIAASCDALVHTGFEFGRDAEVTDRAAVETLLTCARAGPGERLVVYTSGVWVLGPQKGRPATEEDAPDPPAIVAWRPAHERRVLESAGGTVRAAVLRPGCVYGGRGGLYGMLLGRLLETRRARVIGDGSNCWATVYLEDLADLYRKVVEAGPRRALYHATDGSAEPVRRTAEALAEVVGGGELECLSPHRARREYGALADALAMDQRVSSAKARRELGWEPRLASPSWNVRILLEEWHEQAITPSVA